MKLRKIAFLNLSAYKKHYIKLLCEFVALIFLVSLFVSFSVAATEKQNDIKKENISANYIVSDYILEEDAVPEKITWTEVSRISDKDVLTKMGFHTSHVPANNFIIAVGNEKFRSDDDLWNEVIVYSDDNWDIFPENDFREVGAATQDSSRFLLGSFPQKPNEIVVASAFLKYYGLDENILNNEITITAKYDESKVLLSNAVVCGILTDEYCNLSGHDFLSGFSPSILVHSQNEFFADCSINKKFVGTLDAWPSAKTVEYLFQAKSVDYNGRYYFRQAEFIGKMQTVLNAVILYVATAIVFALLISVFVSLTKLREAMYDNSSMLLTLGLTHGKLTQTFLLQFAIVFALSFAIAALLTVGTFFGLNTLLSTAFDIELSVSFAGFAVVFSVAFGIICLLTLLIVTFFLQGLRKRL